MRIASSSRSVPSASALAVYSGVSKRHLHMALGGEVVDLVGLGLLDDADEVGRVGHVAIVQDETLNRARAGPGRGARCGRC